MTNSDYADEHVKTIGEKIRLLVESLKWTFESMTSLAEEFRKWFELINQASEPSKPVPITDRVKARRPRNQIFLEKERRTRQYYPKQNRHARNIIRCR